MMVHKYICELVAQGQFSYFSIVQMEKNGNYFVFFDYPVQALEYGLDFWITLELETDTRLNSIEFTIMKGSNQIREMLSS